MTQASQSRESLAVSIDRVTLRQQEEQQRRGADYQKRRKARMLVGQPGRCRS